MSNDPVRLDFDSVGARIAVYRWDPAGEPRAIAQLTHGVGEYALRYRPLIENLLDDGYVVFSHDHRGHGNSAVSPEQFGVIGPDGWHELVEDIGRVAELAKAAVPGKP